MSPQNLPHIIGKRLIRPVKAEEYVLLADLEAVEQDSPQRLIVEYENIDDRP